MLRWCLITLVTIVGGACLYSNDLDPDGPDRISCTANWDCDNECGDILTQEHTNSVGESAQCGPAEADQGWIGLDDYEVRIGESFDDQDAINFVCYGATRYFPVCTRGKRTCGGAACDHFCGMVLDPGFIQELRCIEGIDFGRQEKCSGSTPPCGAGHVCVRYFAYETDKPIQEHFCVPVDNLMP